MLEYLPWAQSTLNTALEKYSRRFFSILDIELGGECNYHCVYCDSPDRKNDIVNIGLHFFLKNVRPYAVSCSEA